ncbi:MarR family transcriptional regulator [Pseudofrankia asymbiotica]|uniref:MarR family transcriptional regulator n=2 Tax=Pseudofrankia asymbiotica TaxID=1834516 RepID=A0A1V2I5V9_9ACTN|nr:MarR family transcriptional regulator [Pseudofrankia asymbiotica]
MEAGSLLQLLVDDQVRRDGNLSYPQFVLLARLADAPDGRMRMTDLADSAVHSRSGLSYQARLLEDAGLIQRTPSPHDDRSVTAAITDAGRDILARVMPGHLDAVRQGFFSVLDDSQVEALAVTLSAVRDRLRTLVPSATQRRRKAAGG